MELFKRTERYSRSFVTTKRKKKFWKSWN